jgi:hypothetical protein
VEQYAQRVRRLASIYTGLLVTAITTIVLILVKGKLFVTLSQRSNVETLTSAVVVVLFGYLAVVSAPGAWGTWKIIRYNAPLWLGSDRLRVERRKQAALEFPQDSPDPVYLNCRIRRQTEPAGPFFIPLQDEAGSLGAIRIEGARMAHEAGPRHSSNGVLSYFEQRIEALVRRRAPAAEVRIVEWTSIDDDSALKYGNLVAFTESLERHLQSPPLWPTLDLTEEDIAILTSEARQLCPVLRNEAHLPDLEYAAEYRIPIIPEPLAFVSLSRQEQRADPVASMGCALVVAILILGLVVWFILLPPWVPAK